jgi:hypothetical protein
MASLEWSLILVLGVFLRASLGHQIQVQKKQAARTCRKKSIKEHWVSNKAKQSGEEEELQRKVDRLHLRVSLFKYGVLLFFGLLWPAIQK